MLSKLQSMKEEREQGFTLIELLVVILIIGILSAIAIPAFMNQRKSAVDSSVQSDVSNAAKQVETWIVKQGSTSKAIPAGLTVTSSGVTSTTAADLNNPANSALRDIKVSDGTTLKINGTSQAYFIQGTNSGGDIANETAATAPVTGATKGFIYDSVNGGMKSVD